VILLESMCQDGWFLMSFVTGSGTSGEKKPRLKILVVDDDLLSLRLMQVFLTREGYHVTVASSGVEAFEAIQHQQFDIVFMDLHMPMMDGMETSRRIREWENGRRHTFIVALTASYFPDDEQELFKSGIDNYISKPFEVEHIQRMLKQRSEIRSFPPMQALPSGETLDG